jgi:hypothetical protein
MACALGCTAIAGSPVPESDICHRAIDLCILEAPDCLWQGMSLTTVIEALVFESVHSYTKNLEHSVCRTHNLESARETIKNDSWPKLMSVTLRGPPSSTGGLGGI